MNDDSSLEYTFEFYDKCLKEIKKYHLQEYDIIVELYEKLKKGLDNAPGSDVKRLEGDLKDFYRIKIGKNNQFRLLFRKEGLQNPHTRTIRFFHFGKTEDPNKKVGFYSTASHLAERYRQNQDYFKFIPLQTFATKTFDKFSYFINKGYYYSIKFDNDQNHTIESILDPSQIISSIKGTPGSGKTILGAEISLKMAEWKNGNTILIIVPNKRLIANYKNYIKANYENDVENVLNIFEKEEWTLRKQSINLMAMEEFTELVTGFSIFEQMRQCENLLKENIPLLKIFTEFDNARQIIEFYDAFFDDKNVVIEYPHKDPLNKIYQSKIENLRSNITKVGNLFKEKNVLTRKDIAYILGNKLLEDDNQFKKFLALGNSLTIIIDEVQDFIYPEWLTFINFCIESYSLNDFGKIKLIFLGDEKQRITTSGFAWSIFNTKIKNLLIHKLPEYKELKPEMRLDRNYRVTKEIAKFLEFVDNETIQNKERKVEAVTAEKCRYSKEKVHIFNGDIKLLERSLKRFVDNNDYIKKDIKVIIISENDKVSQQIELKENIELLSLFAAKGLENNIIILLNPFKEIVNKNDKMIDTDQNYKIYTMATRSNNLLIILLDSDEYYWIRNKVSENELSNYVEIHAEHEDVVSNIENLFSKVGLDELDDETSKQIILNRIREMLVEKRFLVYEKRYSELNDILLKSKKYNDIIEDILDLFDEYISFLEIDFDLLNQSFQFSEENIKYLLLFWYFANREYIKAMNIAREFNFNNLSARISKKISGAEQKFYQNISEIILNQNIQENNNFYLEIQDYFKTHSEAKSESDIIISYFNLKIKSIINSIGAQ
ncbi:MAG: hypothetical protein HZC46_08265 [Ignavibacterium album]|uniref:DEAD/DEAH box helicase family protein n=1 Tax=Ignavibacterium album TaxID=591197 RepID=UPI0026EB384C|nr:DEAD/DEAH box helicase family protein [Ignavibacterium album]MBI5662127.1 hypothetical protein [Ignavibacterium album]